ncbi:MAG TPA: hypothetical protein VHT05_09135 [Candidatus Elarobacter sp.]|jgi:hypothetical protein|nr:hypothetical protein [Candidatus Elarobacter sp.]
MRSLILTAAALAVFAMPLAATAQPPDGYRANEQHYVGRVIEFRPWHLRLDTGPAIVLHPGTVIHPTGTNLQNGMPVRVYGHVAADGAFAADEIDVISPAWLRFGR